LDVTSQVSTFGPFRDLLSCVDCALSVGMNCEPCDLAEEFALLDALPTVDLVRIDIVKSKNRGTETRRAICTMWCGSSHTPGDLRQPSVMCNQTTVPGIEHAMRALRLKIVEQHAGCLAVAEAARATAAGPATRPPTDALSALMAGKKTQQAYDRAEAAVKAAVARRDALSVQLAEAELEVVTLTAVVVVVVGAVVVAAVAVVVQMCCPFTGHYWLGRVVDAGTNHHLGKGVLKQVTKRRDDINGNMFTEGDIAIAVEWYDRVADDEGLSFEKWVDTEGDTSRQDVINSTELRAASSTPFACGLRFTMAAQQAIQPAFTPPAPPPARRSGRRAAVVEVAAAPPPPDNTIFEMPARVDEQIRGGCWLGVGAGRGAAS
jgi:hypothetical protein